MGWSKTNLMVTGGTSLRYFIGDVRDRDRDAALDCRRPGTSGYHGRPEMAECARDLTDPYATCGAR